VLTVVCYAMTRGADRAARIPARLRIPTYAVWETVVFALNILAFIFIGLQIRPILESLEPARAGRTSPWPARPADGDRRAHRLAHVLQRVVRWRDRRFGFHPPRPMLRPTVGSGLVISWAGMRGIVSLAAALALPPAFPYRDLNRADRPSRSSLAPW
jgi:CPA1 family monovalent cation:H+ antiporter